MRRTWAASEAFGQDSFPFLVSGVPFAVAEVLHIAVAAAAFPVGAAAYPVDLMTSATFGWTAGSEREWGEDNDDDVISK